MSAFNRNIITEVDIAHLLDPQVGTPRTLDSAPPAGELPAMATAQPVAPAGAPPAAPAGAPAAGAPPAVPAGAAPAGGVTVPTADDYLTKLLKYVPLEVLGAYLFVEGLITTNVDDSKQLQKWLFWTLVATIALAAVYARTVLNVVRGSQIAMGAIGIAVYVFATGGWFATTSWYEDWFSGIALVLFGFAVAVIRLPSLPVGGN
jgi:branched-subunit amino acid transport protein